MNCHLVNTPDPGDTTPVRARVIVPIGITAAALQCIFLREYLTVFAGNELVVGVVLAVWLFAGGAGAALGARWSRVGMSAIAVALAVSSVAGLLLVRATPLLFQPGETIPPWAIPLILVVTEAPCAFLAAFAFGKLAAERSRVNQLFGGENLGNLIGALLVFACVLGSLSSGVMALLCLVCLVPLVVRHRTMLVLTLVALTALVVLDAPSTAWKYRGAASTIIQGREGEVAAICNGSDTTIMLNGTPWRTTIRGPAVEQAVHLPMAQRAHARHVLVVFDKGYRAQLTAYPGVQVDAIESEPAFARAGSVVAAPETFTGNAPYDVILLGCGMPDNAAQGRFLTRGFLARMRHLLADSGVVSITLPLSPNMLSAPERRLRDVVKVTLGSVFRHVAVFPGDGYTFMASDGPLDVRARPRVGTAFFETQVLPGVDERSIEEANASVAPGVAVSTADRPIALVLGVNQWLHMFGVSMVPVLVTLGLILALTFALMPRQSAVLSVGATGFAVGVYSVALLLLFQSTYGTLYSRVSLLLVALTAGFAVGSRVRRFPLSDACIGAYIVATLWWTAAASNPPAILFYLLLAGMGVLAGGQFVTRRSSSAGTLYAADLLGGGIGMMLCSTVLAPRFGVVAVAVGLAVGKAAVEMVGRWMRVRGSRAATSGT